MSGEGFLAGLASRWFDKPAVSDELADVIAYLEQRRDNAATIAARWRHDDEMVLLAGDRRRQADVVIDELRAGMHIGSAAVRAELAAKAAAEAAAVVEIAGA